MSEDLVDALVREFWDKVDGGYCSNCTHDAVRAFGAVFPEWASCAELAFERLMNERYGPASG